MRPVKLNLPAGPQEYFDTAAKAVKREYINSVKWKRLRCRKVEHLADNVFIIEVGHSIDFDWTWEGARAFRPLDPASFHGDIDVTDDFVRPLTPSLVNHDDVGIWGGEVVEVDESKGRLFVSVDIGGERPRCGTFLVRPFEFLAFLHDFYCQSNPTELRDVLSSRLNATRGNVHPKAIGPRSGLNEYEPMWSHSWGVLWGPPGCGKTTSLGKQVAACLQSDERILVVSTTNKATDAAAIAVGKAARQSNPHFVDAGCALRIGKGADYDYFFSEGLAEMLRGTEVELMQEIGKLLKRKQAAHTSEERAVLSKEIQVLRRSMKDRGFNIFVSPAVQVVVATAFKAMMFLTDPEIRELIASGTAPFTTIVVDEAGLVPRAVVAALSLLASRRVVVVGDPKQLAPISKMARLIPTPQAEWLASSSLSHLRRIDQTPSAVHFLREQHRMHPQVSRVVSHFQYEGALRDAATVINRTPRIAAELASEPRAIWYVLDDDGHELPSIRAERGPGSRSWVRDCTSKVLDKLFSHTRLYESNGTFVTPFRAQAKSIASYFAKEKLETWSAGTVHARQGTEADVVIFDTVNAGSNAWHIDEWKRLINVGISRARELIIVFASRAEMTEPYLRPLRDQLAPRVLKRVGNRYAWIEPSDTRFPSQPPVPEDDDKSLGAQIARRKFLRPILSKEQQRLCGLEMDGKPRLVRGVAGSGKTSVMANWVHKTVEKLTDSPNSRVWVVYANNSLRRLIQDAIHEAWVAEGSNGSSPLDQVVFWPILGLLDEMARETGSVWNGDPFNFDARSAGILAKSNGTQITSRCESMFIDEAQDFGSNTLKLLTALVHPKDATTPGARAMSIFYDNAQNINQRPVPRWSEIGLDIVGRRSTIMKESFRSTHPITECALNVLYRLLPPETDPDHKELVKFGLIEETKQGDGKWWKVRFNQIEGPKPSFFKYRTLAQEIDAVSDQVVRWIQQDKLLPRDISV